MARPNPARGRWRIMPEKQRVTLDRQITPGVFVPQSVSEAWYRDGVTAERAPSGAVYVGSSTDWFLPKELLPGVTPRPGDRVVSTLNGTPLTDTVLTTTDAAARTVWKLGCLSLELAFGLTDTLDVEVSSLGKDASLGTTRNWGALATGVKCRVQLLTEQAARERGLEYSEGQYEITLDRQLALDAVESRVYWREAAQYLAVVSYRNPRRIDELSVIVARAQL